MDFDALAARARRIPFVTLVEHVERVLGRPAAETIRFRHDPNLVFHTSDVKEMKVLGPGRVEITSTFLGASGTVSPLASFFAEEVLRADEDHNAGLGAFYDVLHHRLLALCYRALQRNRPAWSIRRAGGDAFTRRALAVVGLAEQPKAPVRPQSLLGVARLIGPRARTRAALEAALAIGFPNLRIRVVDFFPQRVKLQTDQRLRVGKRNHRLGSETRVGRSMSAQSDRLRLSAGPVDQTTYQTLLPEGAEHARLNRLVAQMTGGMVDVELELELAPGQEPSIGLGPRARGRAMLGRGALLRIAGTSKVVHARLVLGATETPALFQTPTATP